MTPPRTLTPILFAIAIASGGCAGSPMPIFEAPEPPVVWPASGQPRVAYVGSISTSDDLRAPVGFWRRLFGWIGGSPEPQVFESPYGVSVDAAGRLSVADSEARCVHRFDLESRTHERWVDAGGDALLRNPVGVAATPDGGLVVSDAELNRVVWFDREGTPIRYVGQEIGLGRPVGVAVGTRTGRTYIVDVAFHVIRVVEADGTPGPVWGGRGEAPGQFNFPTHIACDAEERLYVTDTLNFRVQVLDNQGRPLGVFGKGGDGPGDFSQPRGIAVDDRGHIFVVDSRFENVQVFNRDGDILLGLGHEGHGPGEFWLPKGIFIDASRRIWVGDTYNHRVQVFQLLEVTGDS